MAKAKAKPASAKENGSKEALPTISKFGALTEAIKKLGVDAKNEELGNYIRSTYGEAALPGNFSVTKSAVMKQLRGDQPSKEPAKAKAETPMVSSSPSGIDLDDLQEIKDLAERYGKDQVAKALDLVS